MQAPSGHFGCETITDDPGLLTTDYAPEAWWHPLLGKRVAVFEGALLMAADAGRNGPGDVVRARRIELAERDGSLAPLFSGDVSCGAPLPM